MKLTSTQSTINRFNRARAWKEFYPEGNGAAKKGFDLHHINPEWRHTDIERYISWNKEDLQMIPHDEHARLHQASNDMSKCHSPEAIEKMRIAHFGNQYAKGKHKISDEGRKKMGHWKGMKFSSEACAKMSNSKQGCNNHAFGKHWWHNEAGEGRFQKDCPGEGWVRGRLQK